MKHTVDPQPPSRDLNRYEAEYLELRKNYLRGDGSMGTRAVVVHESARIVRAARRAGAELDELALVERARRELLVEP